MKWWFWLLGITIVTVYATSFIYEWRKNREQVHPKNTPTHHARGTTDQA